MTVLRLLAIFAVLTVAMPAAAQLVGNDTTPGESCAAFAAGASRMTASPAGDGSHVTLICDGSVWQAAGGGGAGAGGSDRQIQFNSGGALAAMSDFFISPGGNLSIGSSTVPSSLSIERTNATASINLYTKSNSHAPYFVASRARNNAGNPSAVQANDWLFRIAAEGHNGTEFRYDAAAIYMTANQNWAVGAQGSRLEFYTSENGTNSSFERMRINHNGQVTLYAGLELANDLTPATIGGHQNNYAPAGHATAAVMRLAASAAYNITGLQGGTDGRILTLTNIGTNAITLVNQSGSSADANRFALGSNIVLGASQSAVLLYDSTSSRWRAMATYGGGGGGAPGGSDRQIQFNNSGSLGGVPSFTYNTDGSIDYWLNSTATTAVTHRAARFMKDITPAGNQTAGRNEYGLEGAAFIPSGLTQTVRKVVGVSGYAQGMGSNTTETLMGAQNFAWMNSGTVNSLIGTYGGSSVAGGTVGQAWGGMFDTETIAGTVTTATALAVGHKMTGGTVTNRYGIYMSPPQGSATNDWGIYQAGTQPNHFNGNVSVGTSGFDSSVQKMRVRSQINNATSGLYDQFNSHITLTPSGNQTTGSWTSGGTETKALVGTIEIPGSNSSGVGRIVGAFGGAENFGSGTVDRIMGIESWAYNATAATVGDVSGVVINSESDAGTVTRLHGANVWSGVYGGTVADHYGLAVWLSRGAGTVTRRYGVYVGFDGTASDTWGFYDSSAKSYFEGRIGMGILSPSYRLELPNNTTTGIGRARANAWDTYSDGRFKINVAPLENALDRVNRLSGVSYTWKHDQNQVSEVGFIAQAVREVVPEIVTLSSYTETAEDGTQTTIDDYHSIDYGRLTPLLVEAIKELKAANDNQATEIESLHREIEALKAAR